MNTESKLKLQIINMMKIRSTHIVVFCFLYMIASVIFITVFSNWVKSYPKKYIYSIEEHGRVNAVLYLSIFEVDKYRDGYIKYYNDLIHYLLYSESIGCYRDTSFTVPFPINAITTSGTYYITEYSEDGELAKFYTYDGGGDRNPFRIGWVSTKVIHDEPPPKTGKISE